MKLIITILQNKRVSLPYIFNKYSYPIIKSSFNGTVDLYHIFHNAHVNKSALASNRDYNAENIARVRQFIKDNKYGDANIWEHTIVDKLSPAIPSYKYALEVALERDADFHLWLEDDAIVYDKDYGTLATTIGSSDAGIYVNNAEKEMINIAYFVSTRELDQRMYRMMDEFSLKLDIHANKGKFDDYKGKGSLIEHLVWRASRKPVFLGYNKAFRHHPYDSFRKTGADVRAWLLETIPDIAKEDLDLLKLDFKD